MECIKRDRFANHIGLKITQAEPGFAVAEMDIKEHHLNGADMVQGGAIFTLADYAFAAASNTKGMLTIGVNANIAFMKTPKGTKLIAKAVEKSSGRKICHYAIDITDESGDEIAAVTVVGYILPG